MASNRPRYDIFGDYGPPTFPGGRKGPSGTIPVVAVAGAVAAIGAAFLIFRQASPPSGGPIVAVGDPTIT